MKKIRPGLPTMGAAIRSRSIMILQRQWLSLAFLLSLLNFTRADFAHDLTEATFSEKLKAAKEPWALVEFFASW